MRPLSSLGLPRRAPAGLLLALGLASCSGTPLKVADGPSAAAAVDDTAVPAPEAPAPVDPAPGAARLARLTAAQLRHAVFDLTGHSLAGPLPVDYDLHGYTSVGAGALSIAPYDLELYEAAAWETAEAVFSEDADLDGVFGCSVEGPAVDRMLAAAGGDTGASAVGLDEDCLRSWVTGLVAEAWRRPAVSTEVDPLVALFGEVHGLAGARLAGQAVVATVLVSPDFLFRVELGVPDPDDRWGAGAHTLGDWELASRLAFFLTDAPPDPALRAAAAEGRLATAEGIRAEAERLLATPRARTALTGFFVETLDLDRIETVDKDPALFPDDSPALRAEMREELARLFQELALDSDADLRGMLTTEMAWVGPELARLYGLDDRSEAGWVALPADQGRGGLLGRAGFLALNAAPARTSPTHRGKFVRTRLLCQDILPPPEGVVASLEGIDSTGTLRDTLEQHMTDPACNSCHVLMDPLGFALEDFDALGAWRIADNGLPIDASGSVDGVAIDGAAALGAAVADHERFGWCMTAQLYRHATGALEGTAQQPIIDGLAADFADSGHRFRALVLAVVTSPGFRGVAGPLAGDSCTTEGAARPCETGCGTGVEHCVDGLWQGCVADPVAAEVCDAVDNDCDGVADETPLEACAAEGRVGARSCTAGDWGDCALAAPAPEVCNGEDDDGDGAVDEGLGVELVALPVATLQAAHSGCDPDTTGVSGPCNAATNRTCAARGCDHQTGLGLLALDLVDDTVAIACLDSANAVRRSTTFTELASHHWACRADDPVSADCNASIHRYCRAQGLVTGFGPLEHSGDGAAVACVPTAETFTVSYDVLAGLQPGCTWPEARHSDACNLAIHQWCAAGGHRTGFGPLENSDNTATVACIPGGGA